MQVSDNRAGRYSSTVKCFYEAISLTGTGGNISFGGGDLRQKGFSKLMNSRITKQFGPDLDVRTEANTLDF